MMVLCDYNGEELLDIGSRVVYRSLVESIAHLLALGTRFDFREYGVAIALPAARSLTQIGSRCWRPTRARHKILWLLESHGTRH
jgi:hypothetical protein